MTVRLLACGRCGRKCVVADCRVAWGCGLGHAGSKGRPHANDVVAGAGSPVAQAQTLVTLRRRSLRRRKHVEQDREDEHVAVEPGASSLLRMRDETRRVRRAVHYNVDGGHTGSRGEEN